NIGAHPTALLLIILIIVLTLDCLIERGVDRCGNRRVDSGKSKPQFPMRLERDFSVTTTIYKAQRFAIAAR
ncbi:hypothetical protein HN011_004100, partial [Eciton burchellii]